MQPEIVQQMTPEEFKQAQKDGLIFKTEQEANAALSAFEKQMAKEQEAYDAETLELLKWLDRRNEEVRFEGFSEEDKQEVLRKENSPANRWFANIAFSLLSGEKLN